MKLISVNVRSLPGIPQGFALSDLTDVNIISGPNGAGKTSLCSAVAHCLWAGAVADSDLVDIEATWQQGDNVWIAKRWRNDLTWRCNGELSPGPSLPEVTLKDCFYLRIDDLLPIIRAAQNDGALANNIAREISGGYDINAVRQGLAAPRTSPKALQAAERELREQQQKQQAIAEQEQKLPLLEQKISDSETARRVSSRLDRAKSLAEYRQRLAQCERELADYPQHMDKLANDNATRLQEKGDRIHEAQAAQERAKAKREQAKDEIDSCALPHNEPVQDAKLAIWQNELIAKLAIESQSQISERQEKEAREAMGNALAQLNAMPAPKVATVSAEDLSAATEALDMQLRGHIGRQAQEKIKRSLVQWQELLTKDSPAISVDQFRDGMRALTEWLSYPEPSVPLPPPAADKGLLLSTLLSAVFAMTAGLLALIFAHDPATGTLALLAALASGLAFLRLKLARPPTSQPLFNRLTEQDISEKLKRLHLPVPPHWSRRDVLEHLDALTDSRANALRHQSLLQWLDAHLQVVQADLAAPSESLEQRNRRRDLQQKTGLNLEWQDWEHVWVLYQLRDYLDKRQIWEKAKSEWDKEQTNRADRLTEIEKTLAGYRAEFSHWITEPIPNLRQAQIHCEALIHRSKRLKDALSVYQAAQKDWDREEENRKTRALDYEAFIKERNCDDSAELFQRLKLLPDWQKLSENRTLLKSQIQGALIDLENAPELQALSLEEAEIRIENAERQIALYQDDSKEIARIKQEILSACDNTAISEAAETVFREKTKLLESRQKALGHAAGRWLLDKIDQEHEQSRSSVFNAASELFKSFTSNTYRLKLSALNGVSDFRAIVQNNESTLRLDQLSTGTRVQLLMAVRVAFARNYSAETTLPLWLDETLAHSDPQRRQAIADILCKLATEGQQIFYLTNDPSDRERLCATFSSYGQSQPTCIDLGEKRRMMAGWANGVPVVYSTGETTPEPGRLTAEEYGAAIQVEKPDLYGSVDNLPLYYLLLDDLSRLYRLLQEHLSTVGRWRHASEVSRDRSGLTEDERQELDERVKTAEAFIDLWKEGRPPLIPYASLREWMPGWVEKLWPIVQTYPHDAGGFMKHLENPGVPRFPQAKKETLREKLEENGFLIDEPVLNAEEIRLRLNARSDIDPATTRALVPSLWRLAEMAEPLNEKELTVSLQ